MCAVVRCVEHEYHRTRIWIVYVRLKCFAKNVLRTRVHRIHRNFLVFFFFLCVEAPIKSNFFQLRRGFCTNQNRNKNTRDGIKNIYESNKNHSGPTVGRQCVWITVDVCVCDLISSRLFVFLFAPLWFEFGPCGRCWARLAIRKCQINSRFWFPFFLLGCLPSKGRLHRRWLFSSRKWKCLDIVRQVIGFRHRFVIVHGWQQSICAWRLFGSRNPVPRWLRPNVPCVCHRTVGVIISTRRSTIRIQWTLAAEQLLKLLLAYFVPPAHALHRRRKSSFIEIDSIQKKKKLVYFFCFSFYILRWGIREHFDRSSCVSRVAHRLWEEMQWWQMHERSVNEYEVHWINSPNSIENLRECIYRCIHCTRVFNYLFFNGFDEYEAYRIWFHANRTVKMCVFIFIIFFFSRSRKYRISNVSMFCPKCDDVTAYSRYQQAFFFFLLPSFSSICSVRGAHNVYCVCTLFAAHALGKSKFNCMGASRVAPTNMKFAMWSAWFVHGVTSRCVQMVRRSTTTFGRMTASVCVCVCARFWMILLRGKVVMFEINWKMTNTRKNFSSRNENASYACCVRLVHRW